MKEKILFKISFVTIAITLVATILWRTPWNRSVEATNMGTPPIFTIIIDAGHGGADGGAVSPNGTVESTINLAIAQRLDVVLGFCGIESVMLRPDDASLHSPDAITLRQQKVSDIHNRVAAVEAIDNALLVSIHQNTFPNGKYHGAQVFYANGPISQPLAAHTQQLLRQQLDPENTRVAAPIPDTVYLMHHITCPAILVECGFLSNDQEDAKLILPSYQTKLATTLAGSLLQYQQIKREGDTPNVTQSENSFLLHPMRQ